MDTKALRQKILDLAIRGKLVPQDPNDEPAEVLLERIREQKQQMLKEGKLKKKDIKNDTIIFKGEDNLHYEKFQDGTVKCIEDEIPFEIPEGWEWTRLGNLFSTITGNTPSTKDASLYGDEYPFYKPTDLDAGFDVCFSEDTVSEKGYKNGRILPVYSVLVTCIGATIGKTGYIRNSGICNQQINAILPNTFILPEYTYFCMCSEFEQQQIWTNSSATTLPILNKSKFDSLFFPIPPKAQQTRTVERIKELLHFVEIIQQEKRTLQETIKLTKSKILDLAIHGKLVPQDPNDEPASVLLERIRAEKEELIRQGKIKRDKKESVIFKGDDNSYYERVGDIISNIDDEIPFELPQNWEWSRLQTICYPITDGTHKTPTYSDSGYIFLSAKNITTGKINWNDIMYIPKSLHDELYSRVSPKMNDILLAKNGTTGVAAIVDRECEFDIYVTLALLRVVNNNISSQYLLKIIASDTIQDYFKSSLKGIGVPNLHLEHIRTTLIPIPPINEQNKIAERIYQYYSLLDSIVQNIE